MMKLLLAGVFLLMTSSIEAATISLGEVQLAGDFTIINPFQPGDQPFGRFGDLTVTAASGFFAPTVPLGTPLEMPSPAITSFFDFDPHLFWTLADYTIETFQVSITGADSGRFLLGLVNLTGPGFDPGAAPAPVFVDWSLTAPPFNVGTIRSDITGPVTMTVAATYQQVPEPETWLLLGLGLAVLAFLAVCKETYPIWQDLAGHNGRECENSLENWCARPELNWRPPA